MGAEMEIQRGKRSMLRLDAQRLKLQLLDLAKTIRLCLDPTEDDPERLKLDTAKEAMDEALLLIGEYRAVRTKLREIEQYLGSA